nr:MAG TPA: ENDO-1,4-BETA-XYLANASE Y DEGRADATION, HYDROLASE, GLYCOSIDASE.2A [Caudoviricetes sp.]
MERVNLCANPSFAYQLRGWEKTGAALMRVASDPLPWGGHARQSPTYLAVFIPPGIEGAIVAPDRVPVAGGQVLAVSALVRTSPGLAVTAVPEWTVDGRTVVGQVPALLASSKDGVRPAWAFTAPAGATGVRLRFEARTTSTADRGGKSGWVYIDDVMIVAAEEVPEAIEAAASFFDGDTPQTRIGYSTRAIVHQWVGARGSSASRELEGELDFSSGPVALVESGQAARVQVVIPSALVPAGASCHVEGLTDSGFSWVPRGGVWESDGDQRVIGDQLAPINTPIRYRLTTSAGVAAESTPVVREYRGLSLMTSVTGTLPVDLLWQGTDTRELKPRLTEHEVPGRTNPLVVYSPAMGAGTVSLTARTNLKDTLALKVLLGTPTPVALFHNPAHCVQCRLGTCDVELVTVMAVTSASMERAPRLDVAERTWTIKGTLVGLPQPRTSLALSTWGDFDARALTWAALDSRRWSWEKFDRTIWQEDS